MSIKRLVSVGLAAGFMLFAASRADARSLQIALAEDGGPAFTIVATAANFTAAIYGFPAVATFGDFSVTVMSASSDNGASLSDLLSSTTKIQNNSGVAHTLHVWITQTDYTLPAGTPLNVEGGLGGSINTGTLGLTGIYQVFGDNTNTAFGTGTPSSLLNATQTGTTFDTGSSFGVFNRTGAMYSLTSEANLAISGGGIVNIASHLNITAVPEPASMVLLGSGLLGLAMSARRRRKQ